MWPLTQKRSLRLAVLRRIAVQRPFSSRSNGIGYRSNGSSYPFKKISIRSNSTSYPFKKNSIRSNGSSYPFQKIRQPFERFELSLPKNLHPFKRFELSVPNDSSAVRTVQAIRSKKKLLFVSRSNGSSYPFKKICQPSERLELSVQKKTKL